MQQLFTPVMQVHGLNLGQGRKLCDYIAQQATRDGKPSPSPSSPVAVVCRTCTSDGKAYHHLIEAGPGDGKHLLVTDNEWYTVQPGESVIFVSGDLKKPKGTSAIDS